MEALEKFRVEKQVWGETCADRIACLSTTIEENNDDVQVRTPCMYESGTMSSRRFGDEVLLPSWLLSWDIAVHRMNCYTHARVVITLGPDTVRLVPRVSQE